MHQKNFYNQNQTALNAKSYLPDRQAGKLKASLGFTLMEIIVATAIFVMVVAAMMSLFNYVLKMNRKGELLRQTTQGMRNLVETIVKEVRNGQIDYGFVNGSAPRGFTVGPCQDGAWATNPTVARYYQDKENKLAIINNEGESECIFYGNASGSFAGDNIFSVTNGTLVIQKSGSSAQVMNPPNFKIENIAFFIRPVCDPYSKCSVYTNALPKIHPSVTMVFKFTTELSPNEKYSINYQTTISTNQYDIPNQ